MSSSPYRELPRKTSIFLRLKRSKTRITTLSRGFQHAKDQYVPVTEEELENLEAEANRSIDLKEFIPLASVDPVYFEDTHSWPPTKAARSLTDCSLMPWLRAGGWQSPSW